MCPFEMLSFRYFTGFTIEIKLDKTITNTTDKLQCNKNIKLSKLAIIQRLSFQFQIQINSENLRANKFLRGREAAL